MDILRTFKQLTLSGLLLIVTAACQNHAADITDNCQPTSPDEIGPFYRPNAPLRSKVGRGYILTGTIRSATDCRPLPGAILEFWLVNEQGDYDAAHRAKLVSDRWGKYSFESNRPTDYVGRLPHIHIRVSARGHETLITQHYPQTKKTAADFDLILVAQKN